MSEPFPYTGPSVLRALRAEARRTERERILDKLRVAEVDADKNARDSHSRRPAVTGWGRRAAAFRQALDLIAPEPANAWAVDCGEPWSMLVTSIDSIELYGYDPNPAEQEGEEETQPVRVVLIDGGADVVGTAYLSLEDADQLLADLQGLVARLREERAARAPAAEVEGGHG